MKISIFKTTIRGIRPLIMHNGRLANPMDPHAKNLSAAARKYKGSKSDDDFEAVCKTEFMGALYYHKALGPYLPVDNLQAMLVEGARKRKHGKTFEAFVNIVEPDDADGYKLQYAGPRDAEELFMSDDHRFTKGVKVGTATVQRTRPRFPKGWSVEFMLEVQEGGPDANQVQDALNDAGLIVGLCEWTPRYGRFEVTDFKAA